MFYNTFSNKTVLVTGHTGFKGSWLCIWLKELGADVVGYALEPYTENDNYNVTKLKNKITSIFGDIRDYQKLNKIFSEYQPEFVFHLAAQPIVRESYSYPKQTFDINIGGTVNLLECCRLTDSVRVVINVTSDKCYANKEWAWGYRENDSIGGDDPYSASKGSAEIISTAYTKSFFNSEKPREHQKCLATARAGNVIGGGDWQKDRIIPDCIRALERNKPVEIRNPNAIRPWQHVLEAVSGYLHLASKMYEAPQKFNGAWNFGPNNDSMLSVHDLVNRTVVAWGSGSWVDLSSRNDLKEASLLSLDISKAKLYLNWFPVWSIDTTIEKTVEWYRGYKIKCPYRVCLDQIEQFQRTKKGYIDVSKHSGSHSVRRVGHAFAGGN